ncbi:PepSY domain-containing protein [Nocardiopsis sp. CNT-189]|uniref:PepSY-associated TM helix domain-containing protein n=1 Tax=Nocardiopsis oceanisediminis TaxID=2816862 RepID=UPI003B370426
MSIESGDTSRRQPPPGGPDAPEHPAEPEPSQGRPDPASDPAPGRSAAEPGAEADRAAPPGGSRAALRALLLRLHFYAGVLVAPFLVVAAVTGLLYTFTPQLEQVLYADRLHVAVGTDRIPLRDQVEAATAAYPEGTLDAVRPGHAPDDSTRVLFTKPEDDGKRMGVFVDPYTADVLGELEVYGSSGSLPVRTWLAELHRHLHLGEPGRIYTELAASWLWAVAAGGALLWSTRPGRPGGPGRIRRLLLPGREAGGRRRTLGRHGAVGIWALVGMLFLSATGLSWSAYAGENIGAMRSAFGWETPALSAADGGGHAGHGAAAEDGADRSGHGGHGGQEGEGDHAGHGEHAGHGGIGPDEALVEARAAGLDGPVEIGVPDGEGAPYTVAETQRAWPVQQDQVAVDAADGRVVEELRFDDFPLMAKLTNWGIAAHMGLLFGLPNQLLLAAVAVAALALVVLGYRMWWQRRPTRGRAGFGRPIPRGAWSRLTWRARILVAAAAVAVGLFLPLFGASLLAFVLVDTVIARTAGKRGRAV